MDIVIVTNSPGEITGWVMPVTESLIHDPYFRTDSDRIIIFIPHCQYAGGKEADIAKKIPGVSAVFGPSDHLKFVFFNKGIAGGFSRDGIVIHLGSDYFHSRLISKRLSYPAIAYSYEAAKIYNNAFVKFFVPDEGTRDRLVSSGMSASKIDVVGDLVVDSVRTSISAADARKSWGCVAESFLLGIFSGSRPYQVKYMIPFFLRCCELIKKDFPRVDFVLSRPAFVSEAQIKDAMEKSVGDVLEAARGTIENDFIVTDSGLRIRIVKEMPYEVMNSCDMILTIPGTNTAQIAAAGCPMLVVAPLNKPEEIPLDGLAGHIQHIPFIGRPLKAFLVRKFSASLPFTAIPNRRVKSEVAKEIRGVIASKDVVDAASALIRDEGARKKMSSELKRIMGAGGAADRIAGSVMLLSGRDSTN